MTDKDLLRSFNTWRMRVNARQEQLTNCAAVSMYFLKHLDFMDNFEVKMINAVVFQGKKKRNHFYLKLPDNRIFDATASQFKFPDKTQMPAVYIGEKPDFYEERAEVDPDTWKPIKTTNKTKTNDKTIFNCILLPVNIHVDRDDIFYPTKRHKRNIVYGLSDDIFST